VGEEGGGGRSCSFPRNLFNGTNEKENRARAEEGKKQL